MTIETSWIFMVVVAFSIGALLALTDLAFGITVLVTLYLLPTKGAKQ